MNRRDRPAYLVSQTPIWNYIAKVQNLADHYQLLFLFQRNSWVFLLAVIVCCSVSKPFRTLCDPMDCSMPGFPVLHYLQELLKLMPIESVMPSKHLIFSCPLILPSISPSISIFSNESALQVAKVLELQLQHQPFQLTFRLDSFRIDWFDLAVQGTLKSLFQHHNQDLFRI